MISSFWKYNMLWEHTLIHEIWCMFISKEVVTSIIISTINSLGSEFLIGIIIRIYIGIYTWSSLFMDLIFVICLLDKIYFVTPWINTCNTFIMIL